MNYDQINVFRIIARRESISQAARDLYTSQSSVSKTLKQLENELGVELFERNGNHIRLNQSGEILLHYSDIAINALNDAETLINEHIEARLNMVRVIFRSEIGNPVKALQGFMQDNPKIIPHIATDSEVHDDYDLEVFLSLDECADENSIFICKDKICLICSKNHRLAKSKMPVSIKELDSEGFAAKKSLIGGWSSFTKLCKQNNISPNCVISYEQISGLLSYIQKDYITVGPCVTWLNERKEDYIARPIEGLESTFGLYIRINSNPASRATLSLAKHLRDHLYASFLNQKHCFE